MPLTLNEGITRNLATYNQARMFPGSHRNLEEEARMLQAEHQYILSACSQVASLVPANDDDITIEWFESLKETGPGQGHPIHEWLAESASLDMMKYFLVQESAGEAGFGDLVAMTQVHMPSRAKLELARNYWDEMGQGNESGMHDRLLRGVIAHYGLGGYLLADFLPEPLALANLMVGMAWNRCFAWMSLGALGVIEMTAPDRVAKVNRGLERLGCPKDVRQYFALHAVLDVKHSREWNKEIIEPIFKTKPFTRRYIAVGAVLRLAAGEACFQAYSAKLGLPWVIQ